MTSNLDNPARSRGDRARSRAYLREFSFWMAGYALLLIAVLVWGDLGSANPWRFVLVALPAVPAAGVAWAVLRHVRRIDEYQRRILLEGLAAGFAVAMLAAITLGLLATAGLVLPSGPWIIYGAGMAAWVIGGALAGRR